MRRFLFILKEFVTYVVLTAVVVILTLGFYLLASPMQPAPEIRWGVNFSEKHARLLGLDWKAAYTALLDDMGVRRVKILTHWDTLEPERGRFDFSSLDFQVAEAERRFAELIIVVGMKTGRWPECHLPGWATGLSKEEQQAEVLELLDAVVRRYRGTTALWAWQVENEPFFPFGECPWYDEDFLAREVRLVEALDPAHSIVITDTGEWSLWVKAAMAGDIVGTTLYRRVWFSPLERYVTFPIPAGYYGRKAELIRTFFGNEVLNAELQAEPWGPSLLYDLPLSEQPETMSAERFAEVVSYARRTGLSEFYFWGAEWWYWLREKHNDSSMWQAAKDLFSNPQ